MDRHHHGARIILVVSLLYQSSWKFYVILYMGFVALLPDCHHFHAIVHVLDSLV
jgi:hypothetical protein